MTIQPHQTHQNLRYLISRSWKRLARIGIAVGSETTDLNVTNCESGIPIPGLSVVGGIIFISNPKKLVQLKNTTACVGEGPGVKLEMTAGDTCSDTAWCSELETEEQCRRSCHGVTGWGQESFQPSFKVYLQARLATGGLVLILRLQINFSHTALALPACPPAMMGCATSWRRWSRRSVLRTV